jgi:phenylalanyl-tRNA synthetase beta chain
MDGETGPGDAVTIMNPLSVEQSVMRISLLPGIMETIAYNTVRGMEGLKIFEWGKIFIAKEGEVQPIEKTCLIAATTDPYEAETWYREARNADFYDIKGVVEGFFDSLSLYHAQYRKGAAGDVYDPGASAGIYCGEERIGCVGRLSAKVAEEYEFSQSSIFLFELDVPILLKHVPAVVQCTSLARFPAVIRDISLVVNRNVECATIMQLIEQEGGELIESVELFDMYEGGNLKPSERALGFRICYRSKQGTLEGAEVNRLHESVVRKVREQTGGRLREG